MVDSGLYQGFQPTGGPQYVITQYPLMSLTGSGGYPPIFGYSRKVNAGDMSLIPSAVVENVPIPSDVFAPGIDYVRNTLPGDIATQATSGIAPPGYYSYKPGQQVLPLTSVFDTPLNTPDMRPPQGSHARTVFGVFVVGMIIAVYLFFIRGKRKGPLF